MKWLRDWICHRLGWETYDEAYARFLREMPPLPEQIRDIEAYNRVAALLKEERRKALDRGGEYGSSVNMSKLLVTATAPFGQSARVGGCLAEQPDTEAKPE